MATTLGSRKSTAPGDAPFSEMTYINGYDDPEIIAGAGTMGLELVDQAPDADAYDYIMVPCGGAGLLAGVALASKTLAARDARDWRRAPELCFLHCCLGGRQPYECAYDFELADGLAVPTVGGTPSRSNAPTRTRCVIVEES